MTATPAPNDGMGSRLYPGGSCRFRVWAPFAKRVRVEGPFTNWGADAIDLIPEGNGNWAGVLEGVKALDMYKYMIDNVGGPGNNDSQTWERADARAMQVQSSDGASASYVIDTEPRRNRPAFDPPGFDSYLLYQMHVGSFVGLNNQPPVVVKNRTANFRQIVPMLPYIKGLGFNAIALLPIGDVYCGLNAVGEGYGTSDMFAPETDYATAPDKAVDELLILIDAAHKIGLAVVIDVVYSHSAIKDNRYWQYDGNQYGANQGGEYFENGHDTRFGSGFAFWQSEVKDFFLDNARMFLEFYGADALRFDATQFIQPDALQYITGSLRPTYANRYLIAEYNPYDDQSAAPPMDPYMGLGFSATWDMNGPGQAYNALSGSGPVDNLLALVGDFQNPAPWNSVRYLCGSHDQIYDADGTHLSQRYLVERFGGRGNGWALAKGRLAWALTVALPGTPMMFMGTEGHFDRFWNPDLTSFGDLRFDWAKVGDAIGAPMQQMVKDVNALRWSHPALKSPAGNVTHVDYNGQVVAFKRYNDQGDIVLVVVNLGDSQWDNHGYGVQMGGEDGSWMEIFNSQAPVYGGVDAPGNFGDTLTVNDNLLWVNLPCWSVMMFKKL